MNLRPVLPTLLLALILTGCGDDDEPERAGDDDSSAPPTTSAEAEQAEAILACTTDQDLPGTLGVIEGGVPVVDLTTENETIAVYVLPSEEEAAGFQNPGDFDQEPFLNTVILGGAITPEHRAVIDECIESS